MYDELTSLEMIISGGQTGSDLAGWRAARRFGIPTSGWMPRGWLTEAGPRSEFAELYGAKEHRFSSYPPRTRENVLCSDITIIFDKFWPDTDTNVSRGSRLTMNAAMSAGKPHLLIPVRLTEPIDPRRPIALANYLSKLGTKVLNVAGNRESKAPGIGAWVEEYLCMVFQHLGFKEQSHDAP